MTRTTEEDMFVIRMGIDTLLESVRQSEAWWRSCGDSAAVRRAQQFANSVIETRRKFFPEDDADVHIAEALIVADGLREAARQCREGQGALHARLIGGAQVIEQLCRLRD
jgi:dihydrofolate reductase